MKRGKKILKIFAVIFVLLGVFLLSLITKQDKTPLTDTSFYQNWKEILQAEEVTTASETDTLLAGWAKVNFTPQQPGPMAGYGNRRGKPFINVHDSVFVRTVVFRQGTTTAAIVSADLLIIPPTVTTRLKTLLENSSIPIENIYFGATHTHNSIGGWGTGISTLFFSGSYDPEVEVRIADAIVTSLEEAQKRIQPVQLSYREAYNTANIKNRLMEDEGVVDTEIRAFDLKGVSGDKLTLVTFGAHSTVLSSRTMQLSRDWPGVLVDSLDRGDRNFGMYLAGAVGSMGPLTQGETDFESMINQANGVYRDLQTATQDSATYTPELNISTLPLPLGEPNPRLTTNWALRSWAFKSLFGEFPNEVKALKLGNILMVGVPCDFSGELMPAIDRYAKERGLNLIVTSFNGGYIGYVTDDRWYDLDKYETVTMNWFGPYKGTYFQTVIKDLIDLHL